MSEHDWNPCHTLHTWTASSGHELAGACLGYQVVESFCYTGCRQMSSPHGASYEELQSLHSEMSHHISETKEDRTLKVHSYFQATQLCYWYNYWLLSGTTQCNTLRIQFTSLQCHNSVVGVEMEIWAVHVNTMKMQEYGPNFEVRTKLYVCPFTTNPKIWKITGCFFLFFLS